MGAQSHRSSSVVARDEAILDAVSAGLRRYGPRKLTAQDVADTAGISRMTLYRAMGSMDNAILLTLTREFARAVAGLRATLPTGPAATGADRLAAFLGAGARAFVESELIASVMSQQPELLEPYLSGRLGRSQELVVDAIEELRQAGLRDGSIAPSAPSSLTLLLLVRGVALGAPLVRGDAFDRSCAELAGVTLAALRAGIAPGPQADGPTGAAQLPPTAPVTIA